MEQTAKQTDRQSKGNDDNESAYRTCACRQMDKVYRDVDLIKQRHEKEKSQRRDVSKRSKQNETRQGVIAGVMDSWGSIYHGQRVKSRNEMERK
jgi:hypothetical protein